MVGTCSTVVVTIARTYHIYMYLNIPLIQEGQLSVSGERMCTILVNHIED